LMLLRAFSNEEPAVLPSARVWAGNQFRAGQCLSLR
jgi:hypothetical protein